MATDEKMVEGIQMRLAAVPQGEWHSSLGSGHCVMTAVMSDIPSGAEDYETVFICDVLPDYRVEDSQAWKNRSPLLDFITNAPTDIRFLCAELAAAREMAGQLREVIGKLWNAGGMLYCARLMTPTSADRTDDIERWSKAVRVADAALDTTQSKEA